MTASLTEAFPSTSSCSRHRLLPQYTNPALSEEVRQLKLQREELALPPLHSPAHCGSSFLLQMFVPGSMRTQCHSSAAHPSGHPVSDSEGQCYQPPVSHPCTAGCDQTHWPISEEYLGNEIREMLRNTFRNAKEYI